VAARKSNRKSEPNTLFKVEFAVYLICKKGQARFERHEELSFVPFPGLVILDDALGQFTLAQVAWHRESHYFLCMGTEERKHWSIRTAKAALEKVGWTEDRDARE